MKKLFLGLLLIISSTTSWTLDHQSSGKFFLLTREVVELITRINTELFSGNDFSVILNGNLNDLVSLAKSNNITTHPFLLVCAECKQFFSLQNNPLQGDNLRIHYNKAHPGLPLQSNVLCDKNSSIKITMFACKNCDEKFYSGNTIANKENLNEKHSCKAGWHKAPATISLKDLADIIGYFETKEEELFEVSLHDPSNDGLKKGGFGLPLKKRIPYNS